MEFLIEPFKVLQMFLPSIHRMPHGWHRLSIHRRHDNIVTTLFVANFVNMGQCLSGPYHELVIQARKRTLIGYKRSNNRQKTPDNRNTLSNPQCANTAFEWMQKKKQRLIQNYAKLSERSTHMSSSSAKFWKCSGLCISS